MPDWSLEIECGAPRRSVAGLDEVGRGPLAGPVLAAAVVLTRPLDPDLASLIDDSKVLTAQRREALVPRIRAVAQVGVGWASVEEIDRINILQASMLAMRRALDALPERPDMALVDGNRVPDGLPCDGRAVVGGDALSLSIAAASILAKVVRDHEMLRLSTLHPGYGWERNAGYGTPEHIAALDRIGVCAHHRRSFAPVFQRLAITG
ncbi:ribonuclease HII [Inquilinus limosus]|uniref:Ribonuclease HII n=1 Tax=Inquilinus limosus TaxID=171674 RepID=A0A211ZT58_9PROT|nr:ribonuclease HII [Inquilinus limosus]OWJ68409.1 ribonuclease HII [Inquilinus limosus]